MKKFREVLDESKKTVDHHEEAHKIVSQHSAGHEEGDEVGEYHTKRGTTGVVKHHLHSVHPNDRENLHKALVGAGFKHKHVKRIEGKIGAGNYTRDHYDKGKTHVEVPHHTAWGATGPGHTHHIVDIHTDYDTGKK